MVNVHWCSYAVIKLKFKKYAVLKPRSEKLLVNYHTNRLLQHRFLARNSSEKKPRHFSSMTTNPQQIMTLTHIYRMQWAQIFLQSKYKQIYYGERKSTNVRGQPGTSELWVCLLVPQQHQASCCASIRLIARGFASRTQGTQGSLVFTYLGGLISAILLLPLYTLESFFAFGQPRVAFGQVRRRWKTRMGNGGLIGNRIGDRIGIRRSWGSYMPR